MIQVKNVFKTYSLEQTEVKALQGVSLSISQGEFLCMLGASGSGKSTLLNLIGCLDTPDEGSILIDNEAVEKATRSRKAALRSQKIGLIFQSFNLISVLSVYENIELPLLIKKDQNPENKEWIKYLISTVGLSEFAHHRPSELSGGQRQRVAIARALVTRPLIVLADEPTANLDSKTGMSILELLMDINKKNNTTFLFATHDPQVRQFASRCLMLKDGKILEGT